MHDHVLACLPEEACGLLGGGQGVVRMVIPVLNGLRSRTRFHMDPQGQLSAMQRIEEEGEEIVGIYHSHPGGPPAPSGTDLGEAAYPEAAYLIWAPTGGAWNCRAFRIGPAGVAPLQIRIEAGETPFGVGGFQDG
jgi:proteasome lid subunit RPN8/RPN11